MEHEKLQHLGNPMSKRGHGSLHKLYECSHPSMDALVERAMLCGAFGARLTGELDKYIATHQAKIACTQQESANYILIEFLTVLDVKCF